MRPHRLPPLDTSEYISCPIDTPLLDFDQQSPLPCIIVTPSSPTEYHIAFHHKSSPLKQGTFARQQQQQPRSRRAMLNELNPFLASPPPAATVFNVIPPRTSIKPRTRIALILAVLSSLIACHFLTSSLIRRTNFRSALFGSSIARGGFSSAAAHMRAQRDAQPPPEPQLLDLHALD